MLGSGFGLARYTQQLVRHLLETDLENQYILFFRNSNIKEFKGDDNRNVKIVIADIPWYSLAEQVKFKKIIKKEEIALMHFTHWNVPLFYNDPFVVTVHDLIMYHYPRPEATTLGPIKFWIKDKLHRIVLNHAVKKAKHIIVTSEFTKQDVHETLGVELEKMTVTYQAPFEQGYKDTRIQGYKSDFGITKPYVLCVGAAYPHKNLEGLLQAWKLVQEKSDNYQLVLVGKSDYFYDKLQSAITNLKSAIYLGFIEDDELVELYKNASLYVFPSKYEGFGLPPLEAQQYGTPVVSSSASCLPEVLGESALYFDPDNFDQMADVIYKGLIDESIRHELKQNARENLQRFSWGKLAGETLKIYKNFI